MILSIDLGTTNWKAALIARNGVLREVERIPTPVIYEDGFPCYPADLGAPLRSLLSRLSPEGRAQVQMVALAGMAEAGLIAERDTLSPLSSIWPWFDRRAFPLYEATREDSRFMNRSAVTGLPDSYKYGLYKLLTLLKKDQLDPNRIVWIGLVAYAASLLTGVCAEDVSLASRTGCMNLRTRQWDAPFLASLGLSAEMFPHLIEQGKAVGVLKNTAFGLPSGIPVCIGGHDHVCAAWASGALQRGTPFLSTGTAQVVLKPACQIFPASGFSHGPSPGEAPFTCMGSIQSAGGSINFWKEKLYPDASYDVLIREAHEAPSPSGLLYFPYLAGSGAPHLDSTACGALLGLRNETSRGAVIAGVYEGIAMETRFLADAMGPFAGKEIICTGALTRHPRYMQTLANLLGATILIPLLDEGTLYGAARLAAEKQGGFSLPDAPVRQSILPEANAKVRWDQIYRSRYLPLAKIMKSEDLFHGISTGSETTD